MTYQRLLCLTERVAFVLCSAYCLLLFLSTPSLSASDPEPSMVQGDGWAATYGGASNDMAYSVQETNEGGYVVAGRTKAFGAGREDFWVLKLRNDGTVEWQKTYGGDNYDWVKSIQQAGEGGYIVAGETSSFGAGKDDIWLLRLRPDGTVEWQKTYGGDKDDWAESVQQTTDGGYIVVGETESFGAGKDAIWLLKLRPDGTIDWQKTYGGDEDDWAESVQQTTDGGYIVAGGTTSFGVRWGKAWVLKLRADGTVEWQKMYGGIEQDRAKSVRQTADGGYILGGGTSSFGAGRGDAWVLKLRPDGVVQWQKTYGGVGRDWVCSLQQARDGGYVMAGSMVSFGASSSSAWILKLAADGTVKWQRLYRAANHNGANSIQQTRDGGYIVAGWTGFNGRQPLWVLKLRPDGSISPSCDLMRYTNISGVDSDACIQDTTASIRDTNAEPRDSSATVCDTNVSVRIQCP